jgi:hypothetical protein
METHRFYKDGMNWYIDLPAYLKQGGSPGDLQMVDGADAMLDFMSDGKGDVMVQVSREPFGGSEVLELTEKCNPTLVGVTTCYKRIRGKT